MSVGIAGGAPGTASNGPGRAGGALLAELLMILAGLVLLLLLQLLVLRPLGLVLLLEEQMVAG